MFGLGVEVYIVGLYEFYMGYGIMWDKLICLDVGYFYLIEVIFNKLFFLVFFSKGVMLYVSCLVCWDSDYVVIMDDELIEIGCELVCNDLFGIINIGFDFFDVIINWIVVWVVGIRNM